PRRRTTPTLVPYTTLFRSIVDGQQDGPLLQLGLRAQQHPHRLNQVLAGAQLASGPGGQRTEIGEEPIGTRCQRALALVGLDMDRSEEHTSELQSRSELVCR